MSGTGAGGSAGRKCEATTALGMTCTIEGLSAPRRTVFSFLRKPTASVSFPVAARGTERSQPTPCATRKSPPLHHSSTP